jgi:hypothetical protein
MTGVRGRELVFEANKPKQNICELKNRR